MANKKLNSTVAQQRKAHAELLELKRANMGEITLENEHPLEAAMPKTFWGKLKNNIYHYKVLIIVIAIAVAVGVFGIVECVTKVTPDIEVVAYSYHYISDEQLACIGDLITPYCKDINEDGNVEFAEINCSFEKSTTASQIEYSNSARFQALISGDAQALLFLFDEDSYKHLLEINEDKSFIEGEPLRLNSEIYNLVKEKTGLNLPKGLMIGYRYIKGSLIEKEKYTEECYQNAKDILKALEEKYPEDAQKNDTNNSGEIIDES